jgi:hypothetical protein
MWTAIPAISLPTTSTSPEWIPTRTFRPIARAGPPIQQDKPTKNRLHLHVVPPSDGNVDVEVERLIAAGARRVDVGQRDVPWVVMADPDGNEFCVLTPR